MLINFVKNDARKFSCRESGFPLDKNPLLGDPPSDPQSDPSLTSNAKLLSILCAVNVLTMPIWLAGLFIYITLDPSIRTEGLTFLMKVIFGTIPCQAFGLWTIWRKRWIYLQTHILLCAILFATVVFMTWWAALSNWDPKMDKFLVDKIKICSFYPELFYLHASMGFSIYLSFVVLRNWMNSTTTTIVSYAQVAHLSGAGSMQKSSGGNEVGINERSKLTE